jgi:class 3 adenylate cyclase/pimeloyl-ACP methyl ester carboxylesterase
VRVVGESRPTIRYAKAGEVSIAYAVLGDGPLDVVWVPGLASSLEIELEGPESLAFWGRFGAFSRLIKFDKRGMGLSDRSVGAPTLEERMDDVRAVMDAVGSERAALIGVSEGGPMSMLFAATYPERTVALIVFGALARAHKDVDYPYGDEDEMAELYRIVDSSWGTGESLRIFGPSLLEDARFRGYFARMERLSGSPGAIRAMLDSMFEIDVRAALPLITAPTLVLHTTSDNAVPIANGRWIAEHIPGARFVEIPGEHVVWDPDLVIGTIDEFLTGKRHPIATDRVLSTVLFTDMVASTQQLSARGDAAWSKVLDAHDQTAARVVADYDGRVVKQTGDGILATFDGPSRAVRCATALLDAAATRGINLRAGLHTGEIELRPSDVAGIAVHIASRIAALATANEVLVSRTVVDLSAGSGIDFEPRGEHELKGVPGTWPTFAAHSST